MNSNSGTILPGETANYIAFYIIEQQAADTGKIVNSIATASTASDTTITDTSDDGDDNVETLKMTQQRCLLLLDQVLKLKNCSNN